MVALDPSVTPPPTPVPDTTQRTQNVSIEPAQEQPIQNPPARPANRIPVPLDGPIRDLDETWRLARILSQANLLPKDLRNEPANVFVTILYGRELGWGPMQSVMGIYSVEGRPSLSAQSWRALAIEKGHKVFVPCVQCGKPAEEHKHFEDDKARHQYAADQSATHCAVTCRRKDGGEHTARYTLEDAVQAGKAEIKDGKPYARSYNGKPKTWETVTADMLIARATTRCLRFFCPEIALGFTASEEHEPDTVDVDVALAAAVDARTTAPPAEQPPSTARPAETVDAEVIDEPPATAQPDGPSDEDIRQHVLALAAEHRAEQAAGLWDNTTGLDQ